jgi:succinate dehydrogenase / fumarate reductase cytochrome b subunit
MIKLLNFWQSTIGKKIVMALTGLIMILFLVFHVAANLLVYAGPKVINRFANVLDAEEALLYPARLVLLVAVVLHIVSALQLVARDRAARPIAYAKKRPQVATFAGLTMRWSGLLLAWFIVFHVLHLTTGTLRPAPFHPDDVYGNVVGGFRVAWVVVFYLVSLAALGLHVYHGWWASFRTLGLSSPSLTPRRRPFALVLALILWLGFSSIPIAALAGLLRLP